MSRSELGAAELSSVLQAFRRALQQHQGSINRLNVFPVPDGDTGTNMLLTVESACTALQGLDPEGRSMRSVADAVAKGSLMGARGNSGVILCQVLRALVGDLASRDAVRGPELASALTAASDAARTAVSRPIEGTILTVASGAARAAEEAASAGSDLSGVAAAADAGAREALWSTPSLLAVLAEAGVVDAGGAGLGLLFASLSHVVGGTPLPEILDLPESVSAMLASAESGPRLEVERDSDGPKYEVMYLLESSDDAIAPLRARFDEIGDSTVIVGSAPLYSCHVHTDDVGAAIEAGIEAGRPHEIRVTDLSEQIEEERWVRDAAAGPLEPAARALPPVTSVVAVATGSGIRGIFSSLGVARVVAGGQSMNPSTADILEATEATPSPEVVLLPNNKNIVPVAEQVGLLSTKRVFVVPTFGVQEGFAALLAYDPAASGEENATLMRAAAERVVAGEVTQAVRASSYPGGPIEAGDWLGISRAGIEVADETLTAAACALIDRLVGEGHEIVTLIEGSTAPRGALDEIAAWVEKAHPELELERHLGGQPLYPVLVSVE